MDPITTADAVKILDSLDLSSNDFFDAVLVDAEKTGKIRLDSVALYNLTYVETLQLNEEQLRGALAQKVAVGNVRRFNDTINESIGGIGGILKEALAQMQEAGQELPPGLKEAFLQLEKGHCPCEKCTAKRKAQAEKDKIMYFVSASTSELYIGKKESILKKFAIPLDKIEFVLLDSKEAAIALFSAEYDLAEEDITVINL